MLPTITLSTFASRFSSPISKYLTSKSMHLWISCNQEPNMHGDQNPIQNARNALSKQEKLIIKSVTIRKSKITLSIIFQMILATGQKKIYSSPKKLLSIEFWTLTCSQRCSRGRPHDWILAPWCPTHLPMYLILLESRASVS